MKYRGLLIALALLTVCSLVYLSPTLAKRNAAGTTFTVRVENISDPAGMTASNGAKFPFALSPGMFVLSEKKAPLFTRENQRARTDWRCKPKMVIHQDW